MADLNIGLFILRITSSVLLALLAASLLLPRRPEPTPAPSEIIPVLAPVRPPRRTLITVSCILISLCWLGDAGVLVWRGVVDKWWEPGDAVWRGEEVAILVNFLLWNSVVTIGVWKERGVGEIWTSPLLKLLALVAIASEITFIVLLSIAFKVFSVPIHPPLYPLLGPALHLALSILRLFILIPLLPILYPPTVYLRVPIPPDAEPISERTALLSSGTALTDSNANGQPSTGMSAAHANGEGYSTFPAAPSPGGDKTSVAPAAGEGEAAAKDKKGPEEKKDEGLMGFREMTGRLWQLVPYLWPARSLHLQLLAVICVVILILGRALNILAPISLGELIDALARGKSPWVPLTKYVGVRFLTSVIGSIRSALWAPVMQYSDREMWSLMFNHLMNLSLNFHTKRKTGEVLRVLDRGSAINSLFETLLYNVAPTVLDLIIAVSFVTFYFGADIAAVFLCIMFLYALLSVVLTRQRTRIRRKMNDQDSITRSIHTDCLLNYETVKYFSGEEHEGNRYRDSVLKYQKLEYKLLLHFNLLNFLQSVIIAAGLTVGSIIIVHRITLGLATEATFVVFITYLSQLSAPLSSLGSIYRQLNATLVDAEKLMKLLKEPMDVVDKPDAEELIVTDGVIEFQDVSFTYDDRKGISAVKNVSFTVPKGKQVALVGESGAGKSTLMRLLFRFYDLKEGEGCILIDGKDIRDVTQKSLRGSIGVVPQDSVLFNETIGFNIGYGKFDATEEEIEVAARAAQMHERIMTFPDKYETKVGERGVRLSGGEKQRVAIARTLLKDPPILLLDEATSALDTATERDIQKALGNLVKGRSSLTIAHRLSTIANADVILVLRDGQIAEQGTHRELLAENGIFAKMWAEHVKMEGEAFLPLPPTAEGSKAPSEHTPSPIEGYKVVMPEEAVADSPEPLADVGEVTEAAVAEPEPEASASASMEGSNNVDQSSTQANEGGEIAPASSEGRPTSYAAAAAAPPAPISATVDAPFAATSGAAQPSSPAPIAFPTTESASEGSSKRNTLDSPGVTFSPPAHSRPETPENTKEPKRKRLSSQNITRLARRISLGGRKVSTSSAPSREGSTVTSPVEGDPGIWGEPRKEKKDKKGKSKN